MSEIGYQSFNSISDDDEPPSKRREVEDDEMFARKLQLQWDCVSEDTGTQEETSSHLAQSLNFSYTNSSQKFDTCASLIQSIQNAICDSKQFFIVVRRGASLERILGIWNREATKNSPENVLRVHFAGEDGIDSNAMVKEFLTSVISLMEQQLFPHGSPVDSLLNVHNGTFHACGQIAAVSTILGGPPPAFLENVAYNMLVGEVADTSQLN